jgi:hypothetical protein
MSFIPGMSGVNGATGGLSPLTSIAVAGVNFSESSASVAYPAGLELQEGDAAIFFDFCTRSPTNNNVQNVVPVGYTQLQTSTGNTFEFEPSEFGKCRYTLSYRILDGSEIGTITGMIEDRNEEKFLMVVRGNVPIVSVSTHDYEFLGASSNPAAGTILATTGSLPLIALSQVIKTGTAPAFTTQTPAFATTYNAATRFLAGYTVYNSGPQNHSVDSDGAGISDFGPNNWAGRADMCLQFFGAE